MSDTHWYNVTLRSGRKYIARLCEKCVKIMESQSLGAGCEGLKKLSKAPPGRGCMGCSNG